MGEESLSMGGGEEDEPSCAVIDRESEDRSKRTQIIYEKKRTLNSERGLRWD